MPSRQTSSAEETPIPLGGPLRTLMMAYQIWGRSNACAVAELSDMYRLSAPALIHGMRRLAEDGWVSIDAGRGTLSLTETGARALALMPSALDS